MNNNAANFQKLMMEVIPEIPGKRTCQCGEALRDSLL